MILSNGAVLPAQLATLADTTPLYADASYYSSSYLQLASQWAAYGALYRSQLWVGTVVRKLAAGTARMPFDVKRQGESNAQAPEPGPLAELLRQPNEGLSGYKLWMWTAATRAIYGEAFWLKMRDGNGRVRELQPLHPQNIVVRRTADNTGLEYVYSTGARNVSPLPPFPAADIVAFTSYSPDSMTRGMSNLESLRMTLLNEDASRRATAAFWARGARPSVILTHPSTVSLAAQERMLATWNANQAGADNAGGTAVLEEGIVPHIMQLNSEEMQYIESRKLNRGEVCSAYDVPPPVVHILDHATYSNITEQLRSMYRDTMAPIFVEYESVVNHQLVPDFATPDDSPGDVFTRFNMDEVLRGDFETRATAVGALVDRGLLTPNEGRPMFGQPRYPGDNADKLYANAAMVPLGSPAEKISVTAAVAPNAAQSGEVHEVTAAGDAEANASPTKALIRQVLAEMRYLAIDPPVVVDQAATVPLGGSLVYSPRAIKGRLGRKLGRAASMKERRAALIAEHDTAMQAYFTKQRSAVVTKDFDPASWDGELADILDGLGQATGELVGNQIANDLGGSYSLNDLQDWLDGNTKAAAGAINQTTANQIQSAIDDAEALGLDPNEAVGGLFDGTLAARATSIAVTRVALVGGFASVDAAQQNTDTASGEVAVKTWTLGSGKPRASHAAMDGETVPVDDLFSNGMQYPGDPAGGPDEDCGCTCYLTIGKESA